jgi:ABC-2 type transport system ATP-binding protein
VDRISFDIGNGEVVGLLGPNGAGKTTTMRILTGFLAPTSGSAKVAGYDVVRQSIRVRERVGYLPEANPLYTEMRVTEFLKFRATLKGVPRRDRTIRVKEAIDKCGLTTVDQRIIGQLSKGYRQRVGIADAILHKPDIVVFDEPTIGLDPNQIQEIRHLIRELGQERTVILSTHILGEVELMCRRILIINLGKVVAQGTAGEIAQQLGQFGRLRLEVLGSGEEVKASLDALPGVSRVAWERHDAVNVFWIESKGDEDLRSTVFGVVREKGWNVRELALERPSLEQLFRLVTQGGGSVAPPPEEAKVA